MPFCHANNMILMFIDGAKTMNKIFIFPIILLMGCETMPFSPPPPISCTDDDEDIRMVNDLSRYPLVRDSNINLPAGSSFNIEDWEQ